MFSRKDAKPRRLSVSRGRGGPGWMRGKISHTENTESTEKRIVESGQSPQASAWGNEPTDTLRAGLQPGEAPGEFERFRFRAEARRGFTIHRCRCPGSPPSRG